MKDISELTNSIMSMTLSILAYRDATESIRYSNNKNVFEAYERCLKCKKFYTSVEVTYSPEYKWGVSVNIRRASDDMMMHSDFLKSESHFETLESALEGYAGIVSEVLDCTEKKYKEACKKHIDNAKDVVIIKGVTYVKVQAAD